MQKDEDPPRRRHPRVLLCERATTQRLISAGDRDRHRGCRPAEQRSRGDMNRIRREIAVLVTVLLVAAAFAFPAFAQTQLETNSPYEPPTEVLPLPPVSPPQPDVSEPELPEPEPPVQPELPEPEPQVPGEEVEVGGEVEEVEAAPEVIAATPEAETTTVLGVTLQRTGANALLLGAIGLLVLGLGSFLVMHTRRSATGA